MGLMVPQPGGMKLLWTNPNPTASFAPQTINVPISQYDFIGLVFYPTAARSASNMFWLPNVVSDTLTAIWGGSSVSVGRLLRLTSSGVEFSSGQNNDGTQSNTVMMPYKIYGIKI